MIYDISNIIYTCLSFKLQKKKKNFINYFMQALLGLNKLLVLFAKSLMYRDLHIYLLYSYLYLIIYYYAILINH